MDITERMMDAFARVPQVATPPFDSRLNPEYTREHFISSMIPVNVLVALQKARQAREHAVSYRNFNVGATTVALRGSPSRFQILPGINAKVDENSSLNMHAEQLALWTARAQGFDMVSMVAVVGETQSDTQSGHEMHTLHPCGLCRAKLSDDPMIDNDATLIFSALPDLRTIEASTVNGLLAYHRDEDPDRSGVTLFELPEMEMLTPFTPPEGEVLVLKDSEQQREEDRIWTASIGTYVLEHQMKIRRATIEE